MRSLAHSFLKAWKVFESELSSVLLTDECLEEIDLRTDCWKLY